MVGIGFVDILGGDIESDQSLPRAGLGGQHERALALRENKFGKDHISLITVLESLADADVAEGTPAALDHAKSLLERALAIQEKVLGKNHPQSKDILDRLQAVSSKATHR